MTRNAFDNEKYLQTQSERIKERINEFGGKLYLEFGGKLFDDYHASRVLPGFMPDSKLRMLLQLKDQVEIVIVVGSEALEKSKVRKDLGITYDSEVLRLIDEFRAIGLFVGSVVLTMYKGQAKAKAFTEMLGERGIKVYHHYPIEGYPSNISTIVSDEGYGKNDYIETTRELVVVTAPGPGSGKMATCLSQLYHEFKRGIKAGYAKFETFPIWNIPLKHPVNLAYEAATADLDDVNMIDPFHLEAYGKTAVNYNRDVEIFPVLNAILESIFGTSMYKSPTDMGVNMAGNCISDDARVRKAAENEIVRRYYATLVDRKAGRCKDDLVFKAELCLKKAGLQPESRIVVKTVHELSEQTHRPVVAAELNDGRIITGKGSSLLSASSAMIINALKTLAGVDDSIPLIAPDVIRSLQKLKVDNLRYKTPRLHIDEMLVALSIAANNDPIVAKAVAKIPELRGCDVHASNIVPEVDIKLFKRLGMYISCEPEYLNQCLFHSN